MKKDQNPKIKNTKIMVIILRRLFYQINSLHLFNKLNKCGLLKKYISKQKCNLYLKLGVENLRKLYVKQIYSKTNYYLKISHVLKQ